MRFIIPYLTPPTEKEFRESDSETRKYRHLTAPHCDGCGVDIASQGAVVVPWAISFDLPKDEFDYYNNHHAPKGPIHLRGHANKLPFESDSLDFVYASHILEDFLEWTPVLTEWIRVLKPGGKLIILVPDKELWGQAIINGQCPNCFHTHEPCVGEVKAHCEPLGMTTIQERLTNVFPADYSILYLGTKNDPTPPNPVS